MANDYIFNDLSSFLEVFSTEKTCREFLEYIRWEGKPFCPHCKYEDKIYRFKNGKTYKCGKCRRDFTITVGTMFQNARIPIRKWFIAIYLFSSNKTSISSYQMARYLGITQPNAWYMEHRIRRVMKESKTFTQLLEGIIEVDETYVGGKNRHRHWDKKFKHTQGRSIVDKAPVFGMLQRNGFVIVCALKSLNGEKMRAMIRKKVKKGSIVCTDEYRVYQGLDKYYVHKVVDHSRGQHQVEEIYHTNNIEGFWNFIKRSIKGTYRKVDRYYMNRYAVEAAFRYNTRKLSDADRFVELLRDFLIIKATRRQIRKRYI
jgi:transposase-like protein